MKIGKYLFPVVGAVFLTGCAAGNLTRQDILTT